MRRLLGLLLALMLAACAKPQTQTVTVSAAASLGGVMAELKSGFEAHTPGVQVLVNLGSSGALARQIEQGAPVDLFLAAAPAPVDRLVQLGLVEPGSAWTVATNRVVLVRARSGVTPLAGWRDLDGVERIALGNPEHVPAGQYGLAVLQALGLNEKLRNRLVYGEDVRQVLRFVESGEVGAGIVYSTDARSSSKLTLVAEAPPGSHPAIRYPMALLKNAPNQLAARQLADFLRSDRGREVFVRHGFGVVVQP